MFFCQRVSEEEKSSVDEREMKNTERETTDELESDEVQMKDKNKITVGSILQWLTGQAHVPVMSTERERFRIQVEFDHDSGVCYGTHTICFPVVNACSNSITFPTKNLSSYPKFVSVMTQAVSNSREFGRA